MKRSSGNGQTLGEPSRWRTGISTYEKARFEGVYKGIDLLYYGNQRQLEYDFILAPGADSRQIRMAFDGASAVQITPEGDLVLQTAAGEVRQQRPISYQDVNGARSEVPSRY